MAQGNVYTLAWEYAKQDYLLITGSHFTSELEQWEIEIIIRNASRKPGGVTIRHLVDRMIDIERAAGMQVRRRDEPTEEPH